MHATFIQKVILCMIAGFFAACLIQWGKVFVTGADDALNKGYKHTAPGFSTKAKP
jgi:nucleoside recognition membrane protein YjiH